MSSYTTYKGPWSRATQDLHGTIEPIPGGSIHGNSINLAQMSDFVYIDAEEGQGRPDKSET